MKMEYIIINSIDERKFVRRVNEYIAKGWRLQGGVSNAPSSRIMQAMVREVKDE